MKIPQRIRTAVGARDFLTHERDWLSVQNGALTGINEFDPAPRYIRNGRDLGEYVHRDFTYQAFLSACLMLNKLGVPLDGSNPYKHSYTQSGFSTFGAPYLLHLVAVVANVALRASWYQKWLVHRRLRPEELAGRVQVQRAGKATYPLHRSLLDAPVLDRVASHSGSHLLSQAYPEGSPTHPSYPAGHAIIAGACVTVMKAFFDESFVIPSPVVAARDGLSLLPWKGSELTVGGELDKLASNVAIGRNFAGIHWRSDATEGLRAGEWTAIEVLREMRLTGNEMFSGFSLRRFDGQRITI